MGELDKTYYRVPHSRTIDGDKIFELHDTHGVTIEISAMLAQERGLMINWIEFIRCARRAGWNIEALIPRIKTAMLDAGYNDDWMKENFGEGITQEESGVSIEN